MPSATRRRRTLAAVLASLLALSTVAACGDDTTDSADDAREPRDRPEMGRLDDDRDDDDEDGDGNDADSGDDDSDSGDDSDDSSDDDSDDVGDVGDDGIGGMDLDEIPIDDRDDAVIEATIAELEVYWSEEFSTISAADFEPIQGGLFPAHEGDTVDSFCGPNYEDVFQNAFYCPVDDTIVWDSDGLTNDLLREFGPFALVILTSHEFGHAISYRIPVGLPETLTIAWEQQADCFAGSFTAWLADGNSEQISVTLDDLDIAMAGFLLIRDPIGSTSAELGAHGSAFDRVGAFQDGFLNGADRCADYEDIYLEHGTTVVDLEFLSEEDFQSGGNAPFDEVFDDVTTSLEAYWSVTTDALGAGWEPLAPDGQVVTYDPRSDADLPPCNGDDLDEDDLREGGTFSCFGDLDDPDDDLVAIDVRRSEAIYDAIGDIGVAVEISQQYAFAVQALLGDLGTNLDNLLQADCYSGAWIGQLAADTFADDDADRVQGLLLSPADLDEVVLSFLLLGEEEGSDDAFGNPFLRLAAFRDGFRNTVESCATYLDEGLPEDMEQDADVGF